MRRAVVWALVLASLGGVAQAKHWPKYKHMPYQTGYIEIGVAGVLDGDLVRVAVDASDEMYEFDTNGVWDPAYNRVPTDGTQSQSKAELLIRINQVQGLGSPPLLPGPDTVRAYGDVGTGYIRLEPQGGRLWQFLADSDATNLRIRTWLVYTGGLRALLDAILDTYTGSALPASFTGMYLREAPANVARPYITFLPITGGLDHTMSGKMQDQIVQFDVWYAGESANSALILANAVMAVYDEATLTIVGHNHVRMYRETEPNLLADEEAEGAGWRVQIDYHVWYE